MFQILGIYYLLFCTIIILLKAHEKSKEDIYV
mgnify:FL=1